MDAQQPSQDDSVYVIQYSVLILTRNGVDIFAIIVWKKTNTTASPAILFYTTYDQDASDVIFGENRQTEPVTFLSNTMRITFPELEQDRFILLCRSIS